MNTMLWAHWATSAAPNYALAIPDTPDCVQLRRNIPREAPTLTLRHSLCPDLLE
jgi:hypothetical protein